MAFNPITVNKGPSADPHIYAEDDAAIFQSMFGEDGILDIGSKLELSIQSNNLVRMSDGALCVGGHIGRIKYADYVDLTIDNGETGYNRNDLIIGSFSNTGEHTIDTFEPQVVKGTPATGSAVDPTLTDGSLYEGDHLRQVPVARVRLEGLNIVGVDMLLQVIPSIPSMKEQLEELNSKISYIGDEQTYSENGWTLTYRNVGAGFLYVTASRTTNKVDSGTTYTEIYNLPFNVPFQQKAVISNNVGSAVVGNGVAMFNGNQMQCQYQEYGSAVTNLLFGLIKVSE